jgi:hypothetical protein
VSKPIFEIELVRKDGAEQTFTNYKGEEVSKKWRKVGVIFPSRLEGKGGGSLVFDKDFDVSELVSGDYYINVNEPYGAGKPSKTTADAAKKAVTVVKRKAPAKTVDEGDDLP